MKCKYCDISSPDDNHLPFGGRVYSYLVGGGGIWRIISGNDVIAFDIKYCPMCGRRLSHDD